MDAAQVPQPVRAQALHPQGQAVDPGRAIGREVGRVRRARIGLQGDFGRRVQGQALANAGQQPGDGGPGEEAGGAATDEEGDQGRQPRSQPRQIPIEIAEQGLHIGLLGDGLAGGMGIEVAIGALANAPGDVDVKAEG